MLLKVKKKLKTVKAKNYIFKIKEENRGLKINLSEEFKRDRYQIKIFLL